VQQYSPWTQANTDQYTEADEAYVIGKRGQYTPVGAYLAGDEIIKIAVEHGAQMVHPGTCRPGLH
jgi:pyruvate carboxylase